MEEGEKRDWFSSDFIFIIFSTSLLSFLLFFFICKSKIKEGNKERIQFFKGDVLQIKGKKATQTFTIRKISNNVGVERVFPMNSPMIENIEVNKVGKVRRARIFYLRGLTGKKARIKEVKK